MDRELDSGDGVGCGREDRFGEGLSTTFPLLLPSLSFFSFPFSPFSVAAMLTHPTSIIRTSSR